MVEAIVSTILEKLTEMAIDKASEAWKLVRGVEEEVKRLQSNFGALRFVLEDAEEKQYLDNFLKHWLDRFQDVSYDMEDVLDDWQTAVLQPQALQKEEIFKKFFSCFSSGSQFVRRHGIAARIKQINQEVEKIVQEKAKFELVKKETKQPQGSETAAFVDVLELIGRDKVSYDIIKILLCAASEGDQENPNIPTISIVGMGGLGKTSLAQLIYNDERVKAHFDNIIWVFVGNPFNLTQIARAILEELDPDSKISLQNSTSLQSLFRKISLRIKGKKFFLVLDDVWTDRDDDWKQLKSTLKNDMPGCWILVTTRKRSVASQMDRFHVFPLEELDEEMCWLILAQNAFAGSNKGSRENFEDIEDIGRKLARKCEGLPLAAKALGGLLRGKTRREEWENVLNTEIWKPDFEKEIFTPLLLSYFDLPSEMRQCLSYCAIFEKNYRIRKDELIPHWMAQRYLNANNILQKQLEGEHYVEYLAARSFFQDFGRDINGNISTFRMHDLVHDFVQFLTKDRFVTEEVVEDSTFNLSSKRARHLRLIIGKGRSLPMYIGGTEKLRSLVVVSQDGCDKEAAEACNNLFRKSKRLRFLEFNSLHLYARKIDIGNLTHLRHLSLKYCRVRETLPKEVCELCNLESLNLQFCIDLKMLPHEIGKLIKLSYLCVEGCDLSYLPKEIGNLTSLIRLTDMIITVRADCNFDKFSIGDLEKLDLLHGSLCMELIGDTIDWDEVKRAKLCNKTHLKKLYIYIRSPDINAEEVRQALNPPSSLFVRVENMRDDIEELARNVDEPSLL